MRDFIDTGDRVRVKAHGNGMGSSVKEEHVGLVGEVTSNDGWGKCGVLLDNGQRVTAWNAAELERE